MSKKMNKYFEATNRMLSHIDTIHWVEEINIGDKDLYEQDKKTIWELVEKATPKKLQYDYLNHELVNYHCPNCGEAQGLKVNKRWRKFCPHCGQALDWSEEDESN